MLQKTFNLLALTAIVAGSLLLVNSSQIKAADATNFKAGKIISDRKFTNSSSMSTRGIQDFLESKNSTCLKNFESYSLHDDNGDGVVQEGTSEEAYGPDKVKASKLIKQASDIYGINPRVLLVTLQKEQGLITRDDCPDWRYKTAMGYGCPDGEKCDENAYGFTRQIDYGAYHFRGFFDDSLNHVPYSPGEHFIDYHPNDSCGGSNVYIQNRATAALYSYTPYQPNQAALNAGYGTGNSCSSYGNRNFWLYYTDWFGSTTGSPLFQVNGSPTYYLEWDEYYYPIPSEDALYAYGLERYAPRKLSNFPASKEKGSYLSKTAKFGSDDQNSEDFTGLVNIVTGGKRHGLPNHETLAKHGYSGWETYDPDLKFALKIGDPARPVVRKPNGAVYLMENGKRRGFPDYETYATLEGENFKGNVKTYSEQQFTNISSRYIKNKEKGAPMLLNGKFLTAKGSPGIYLHDGTQLYGFSAGTYSSWGGPLDYEFSANEVSQITDSGSRVPVLVKSASGNKYLVDSGRKKQLSTETQNAWGFANSDFVELTNRALARLPKTNAGTLIQQHNGGIYKVSGGQRHPIPSLQDFNGLGYKWSNVEKITNHTKSLLPFGNNLFAPGQLLRKSNGAVYLVDENFEALGVASGATFNRFGFKWSNVRNVSNSALSGYATETLQTLLKSSYSSRHYVVEGGVRHYMDADAMSAEQYDFNSKPKNVVHRKTIRAVEPGGHLTRYLRGPDDPTVYYIENGKRRPFTTERKFRDRGGTWDKVKNVSRKFLEEIPRGSVI